jgi:hypothetical protein
MAYELKSAAEYRIMAAETRERAKSCSGMVQQQLQIIAAEFDAMAMTVEGKPASQGPTDPKQS